MLAAAADAGGRGLEEGRTQAGGSGGGDAPRVAELLDAMLYGTPGGGGGDGTAQGSSDATAGEGGPGAGC